MSLLSGTRPPKHTDPSGSPPSFFTQDEIHEIHAALLASGIDAHALPRELDPEVRGLLNTHATTPSDGLLTLLATLNRLRCADGSVPFRTVLKTAACLAGPTEAREVIKRALATVLSSLGDTLSGRVTDRLSKASTAQPRLSTRSKVIAGFSAAGVAGSVALEFAVGGHVLVLIGVVFLAVGLLLLSIRNLLTVVKASGGAPGRLAGGPAAGSVAASTPLTNAVLICATRAAVTTGAAQVSSAIPGGAAAPITQALDSARGRAQPSNAPSADTAQESTSPAEASSVSVPSSSPSAPSPSATASPKTALSKNGQGLLAPASGSGGPTSKPSRPPTPPRPALDEWGGRR